MAENQFSFVLATENTFKKAVSSARGQNFSGDELIKKSNQKLYTKNINILEKEGGGLF